MEQNQTHTIKYIFKYRVDLSHNNKEDHINEPRKTIQNTVVSMLEIEKTTYGCFYDSTALPLLPSAVTLTKPFVFFPQKLVFFFQ